MKRNEDNLRDLRDNVKRPNIQIIGVQKKKTKRKAISFPILGKFSTIISSNIYSRPFFLSSSGTPMIRMLGLWTLFQRSLRLSSFLLIRFSFFLSA